VEDHEFLKRQFWPYHTPNR